MSLSEDLRRLADCKTNIKQSIQDKGVTVDTDQFERYPEFIRTIDTDKWKSVLIDTISIPPDEEYGIFNNEIAQLFEEGAIQRIAPNAFFRKSFDIQGMEEMNLRNVETILWSAFEDCQNVPKIIGSEVREIGGRAFKGCSWKTGEVVFPQCTRLEDDAFMGCKNLISVRLSTDQPVEVWGADFFAIETLTNVEIKWGEEIPPVVFGYCKQLENIGNTEYVKNIGESAFTDCISMTHYHFPSCERLYDYVFKHNTNLQVISFVGGDMMMVPELSGEGWLFSAPNDTNQEPDPLDPTEYSIIVPDDLYDEWITNEKWAKYADHIVKESEFGV